MSDNKIKVVALGGCGGMGQFAVKTALQFENIETICIADKNIERARDFSIKCGYKTKAYMIDITDKDSLIKLLSTSDIVMNTTGPYYRYGVPILEAAINSKCNYIDLNDDWEPSLEMLSKSEEAKHAGITAIIGMGASPGITNMLAAKAVEQIEIVDDLITIWGAGSNKISNLKSQFYPGDGGTFGSAIEHLLHQITGTIRIFKKGKFIDIKPLEKIIIDYPGNGKVSAYIVGHPEAVTLPITYPDINNCFNAMALPEYLIQGLIFFASEVENKRMTLRKASRLLLDIVENPLNTLLSKQAAEIISAVFNQSICFKNNLLLKPLKLLKISENKLPEICAIAIGTNDGKKTACSVSLSSSLTGDSKYSNMGALTGIPLAVGLDFFSQGIITKKGVFSPEAIFNPDMFFDRLAPLCNPARKNSKDLLVISTVNL